jgi:hypothetical protein
VLRRALAILVCALALASCRLDTDVVVQLDADGTGTVTVAAVADAELVAQVPGLAESLVFDDAVAAGWEVVGPSPTDDGGLEITLTHPVSSPEELANVLNSIGPPFSGMAAGRTTVDEQTTNAIDGTLVLPNGFESFADADLLAAVGGLPFEDEFAAIGTTPSDSMSVRFEVSLPGELVSTTGTEVDGDADAFEWQAPLDGTSASVATQTVQRPAEGGSWAGPVSTVALVALVVWVILSVVFIAFVVSARRRRARQRRSRRSPARSA